MATGPIPAEPDPRLRFELAGPTPDAAGAIGLIRVTAPSDVIDSFCAASLGGSLGVSESRLRPLLGVDRGVAARPSEDVLLLCPHAGPAVIGELLERLARCGVRTEPDAGGSSMDTRLAHALWRARSPLAIDLLLDQPRRWRAEPDPDPTRLEERSRILDRLIEPATIALVGAPNIGKSSLLNALAGAEAALVEDEAGTTLDHLGVAVDLGGVVAHVLDLPGLEASPGGGPRGTAQRLALEALASADLVVLCADGSAGLIEPSEVPDGAARLRVGLRSDLGRADEACDAAVSVHDERGTPGTGGLSGLVALLRDTLVAPEVLADPGPWRFWDSG